MKHLKLMTSSDLRKITKLRKGEVKFGEKINIPTLDNLEENIKNSNASYILFGIEEDFGVRANGGVEGTRFTWEKFIANFVNIQHNKFNKASNFLLLGSLNYNEYYNEDSIDKFSNKDYLFNLVSIVDKDVSHLVFLIKKYNKIPIVVGGGHNNSYGIIKGCALANKNKINVLNLDAHADFRDLEGRHSGNGFSYAYDEKFLNKYLIYGLHESYISKNMLKKVKTFEEYIKFVTLEEILFTNEYNSESLVQITNSFFDNKSFGLEIDLDVISNINASALTPSGIELNEIRKIIFKLKRGNNFEYLHICEGIMTQSNPQNILLSKTIIFLINDFVKN